jgi:hypothetical protein
MAISKTKNSFSANILLKIRMTLDVANTGSITVKVTKTTPTIAPKLGPTVSFVLFIGVRVMRIRVKILSL